jgi:hypothetical protein
MVQFSNSYDSPLVLTIQKLDQVTFSCQAGPFHVKENIACNSFILSSLGKCQPFENWTCPVFGRSLYLLFDRLFLM